MKISQDIIDFIETVVKTGQSVNIDNVIIESDMVRAIDDARTVVLYQSTDVPELPFGSIGLNRIGVFLSRLDIAKNRDDFTLDVIVGEGDEYARSILMRGTGTKIDYRCANPATIQAPRQINDKLAFRVNLNTEAVDLLNRGAVAMGSETVAVIGDDGVSFELTDVNGDVFKHTFTANIEFLTENPNDTFSHKYPVKTLLSLFKQNPNGYFEIGEKGILSITVNGLDIYVLPQV